MAEVLEWDVRVPLVSNVYVLVDILVALLLVSGSLMAGVMYLTGFKDVLGVFRLFLIADGVLIVLVFMVMGLVFTNRFQIIYNMDSTGVLVKVGEFESSFNRLAWRITGVVQRHGVSGGKVFSMINEELFVSWTDISHALYDERRRVISLIRRTRPVMRIYCSHENFGSINSAIQGYVPEPEG